jgi:hypothetical protein
MGHEHRTTISPREHARLAGDLIDACGGLAEASRACRVSEGVLSTYQNPNRPECNMPADVMSDLEKHCGKPIYSGFIRRNLGLTVEPGNLRDLGCLLTEEGADFQAFIRRALADGVLSANEIDTARQELAAAENVLARCRASLDAAELSLPRAA